MLRWVVEYMATSQHGIGSLEKRPHEILFQIDCIGGLQIYEVLGDLKVPINRKAIIQSLFLWSER